MTLQERTRQVIHDGGVIVGKKAGESESGRALRVQIALLTEWLSVGPLVAVVPEPVAFDNGAPTETAEPAKKGRRKS